MPRDFIPRRDAEFLGFCANFSEKVVASWNTYGLSVEQAAQYALAQEMFAADYHMAIEPGTSTVVAVQAKNHAREVLEAQTRMLARIVRSLRGAGVTDADLCNLHLCVPRGRRKRVPPPSAAPLLIIDAVKGMTVHLRLADAAGGRGKPRDVSGATLLYFRGEEFPNDPLQWTLLRHTKVVRTKVTLRLPQGTKVWLAAFWRNFREQPGPMSTPISTYLSYGGSARGANAVPPSPP